jgi:DASS family divalent anion:Na+ symporter
MKQAAALLRADSLLGQCPTVALARLLPSCETRSLSAGQTLYRAGTPATHLYLRANGQLQLTTPDGMSRMAGTRFGEEALTDADHYVADAIATTPVTLIGLPRASLLPLLAEQPALKAALLQALLATLSHSSPDDGTAPPEQTAPPQQPTPSTPRLIGWLMTLIAPPVIFWLASQAGLERNASLFLAIFAATVVMWAGSLVDDYLPGLFAVMAVLIAGLVPPPVILSGFASDGFMMALSILGLSAVLVSSGLSYRTLLWMLHHLPPTRFWQNLGLTSLGIFLTPLIPTINGRAALLAPFSIDMTKSLRLTPQGIAASQLAISAFAGISLLSASFLSSKSVNFVIFGMLPAQAQGQYQGFKWLLAAAASSLTLLIAHLLASALLLRSTEQPRLKHEDVTLQRELLGPLSRREWAALLGIGVFIGGMLTATVHQVQAPWLGLAIFYGLLLFGSLSRKELKEQIDWPFLLYLSGLTGLVSTFNTLGLDQQLAAALPGLGNVMREQFALFVLLLFGLILIIRLAVPISATIVILASLLMPVAEINGVNPWVVGFIILLLGEIWFLPYQCSYYLQWREIHRNQPRPLYDEHRFLSYNALMNLARLAAVYVSLPFWKAAGLL